MPAVHLVALCHGLWGEPEHTAYLARSLAKRWGGTLSPASAVPESTSASASGSATPLDNASGISTPPDVSNGYGTQDAGNGEGKPSLVVLNTASNRWLNTYDGIDWCAERVVREIHAEVRRLREVENATVTRFSIVGYSLGGLIARYAIGLLHSQGFFDGSPEAAQGQGADPIGTARPKPASFTTFATPHLGIPPAGSTFGRIAAFIGGRMLSRTGEQLYVRDEGWEDVPEPGELHSDAADPSTHQSRGKKNKAPKRGLLDAMTVPGSTFMDALERFETITVFANALSDVTVPYRTGAIEEVDPFILKGTNVTIDEHYAPLVASFSPASSPPAQGAFWTRMRESYLPSSVPWLLNPRRYPFHWPLNYLTVLLLPFLLPLFICIVLVRFQSQARGSRIRVRELERKWALEDSRAGEEPDAEAGGGEVGPGAGTRSFEGPNGVQANRIQRLLRQAERRMGKIAQSVGEDNVANQVDEHGQPLAHLSASEFDAPARAGAVGKDPSRTTIANGSSAINGNGSGPMNGITGNEPPLTPVQRTMARRLNSLPHLQKRLAYIEGVVNSHAIIICRAPSMELHQRGKPIVRKWTDDFVL